MLCDEQWLRCDESLSNNGKTLFDSAARILVVGKWLFGSGVPLLFIDESLLVSNKRMSGNGEVLLESGEW